jgi:hypothetical protein
MNHRTWVIDLVLMFRLVTAKADEPQGPTTLELDACNNDPNDIEEAFQKDLLDQIAWIGNRSCRMFQ